MMDGARESSDNGFGARISFPSRGVDADIEVGAVGDSRPGRSRRDAERPGQGAVDGGACEGRYSRVREKAGLSFAQRIARRHRPAFASTGTRVGGNEAR